MQERTFANLLSPTFSNDIMDFIHFGNRENEVKEKRTKARGGLFYLFNPTTTPREVVS